MADLFNEVLGNVGQQAKEIAAARGEKPPVQTKIGKQAPVAQFTSGMAPAFKEASQWLDQQSAEAQQQPSAVTGPSQQVDDKIRRDPLKGNFVDDAGAAFRKSFETNLTASVFSAWTKGRPEFKTDPNYDWAAVRNEVVGKYGPEFEDKLASARSAEELKYMTEQLDQERKDAEVMGRSFVGSALGTLLDPLTLAVGAGEVKGLQVMWQGMKGATRGTRLFATALASGASAGGQEALRQELQYGAVDDPRGVGAAALFASALGTVGAAWASRGAAAKAAAAPEGFASEQAAKAGDSFVRNAQETIERVKSTTYQPPKEQADLFPDVLAPTRAGDMENAIPPEAVPTTISASAPERNIIDFSRKRVEAVKADAEAQSSWEKFISKIGEHTTMFDDFGKVVENSNSPTAKTLMMMLGEDSTGRFRKFTPDTAVYKDRLKKVYESHLLPITTEFNSWLKRKGYSELDLNHAMGEGEREFNRLLRLEVEARYNTRNLAGAELEASDAARWANTDPEIKRAADALDNAHSFAREAWGNHDETVKQAFGDSSRGYLLRKLDGKYLEHIASTDMKAYREYVEAYARSLQRGINAGIDARIAAGEKRKVFERVVGTDGTVSKIAKEIDFEHITEQKALGIAETMFEDARSRAAGMEGPTVGLLSNDGREQLRNLMKSKNMPEHEIDDFFSIVDETVGDRGRSARAKGRLNVDIISPDPVNGRVPLDVFDNNIMKLTNRYADEFSGRTAMARVGIKNDAELDTWLEAARKDGATGEDIKVLKGVAEKLLGRTDRDVNRAVDLLHSWARTAMLGQASFAQAVETATVAANVGIWATAKAIPGVPRLMKDLVKGEITHPELKEWAALLGDVGLDHHLLKGSRMADNMHAQDGAVAMLVDTALKYNKNVNNILSGFNVIHGVQRQLTVMGMKNRVYDMLMSGQVHKRLEDAGIHGEWIGRIKKQLEKYSTVDENDARLFNTDKWDDFQATEKVADSMHRVANQIIQGHMIGETSAFMDGNVGRILTGFRTFPIVALRKQLLRNLYMADSVTWINMTAGLTLSAVLYAAKANLNAIGMTEKDRKKYLDARLSDTNLALGAFQYAGTFGPLSDIVSAGTNWASGQRRFDSDYSGIPTLGFVSRALETSSGWAHAVTGEGPQMSHPFKKSIGLVNNTLPFVWIANSLEK